MVLLLDPTIGAAPHLLSRADLAGGAGFDEKWLQALVFAHPALLPLAQFDPSGGAFTPLARELALAKEGGTVFLDVLGVTASGRITLVECKLWRNPQARREVLAQILEYAALLRGWSYADLTAKLKATRGMGGANPIFAEALARSPGLKEAAFVDAVSASLRTGEFNLVIAGDGIRSDLEQVASHFNANGLSNARLSLVEMQLWSDPAGRVLVVPQVPVRTEVIRQRVLIAQHGLPLVLEEPPPVEAQSRRDDADPARRQQGEENRAFWQKFIDTVRFDHPDQGPPRHGGNNWVRIDLPQPSAGMTGYRTTRSFGFFIRFENEDGALAFTAMESELDAIAAETGLSFTPKRERDAPFKGTFEVWQAFGEGGLPGADEQLAWLTNVADRIVTSLRPRIGRWQQSEAAARPDPAGTAAAILHDPVAVTLEPGLR